MLADEAALANDFLYAWICLLKTKAHLPEARRSAGPPPAARRRTSFVASARRA